MMSSFDMHDDTNHENSHCTAVLSDELYNMANGLAQYPDIPILIFGETGTGKGVFAEHLHQQRRLFLGEHPFISVNCAMLNSDVADSTIFGHKKGAFTGAQDSSIGAVGEADGGILFLDEIHCLSMDTQRKLLRLLDRGRYTRVGESVERQSNFQLVVATNQNLPQLVKQKQFLLDLLMRIQGVEVKLLPLRERRDELPLFIDNFFEQHNLYLGHKQRCQLIEICSELHWPGNVRQLYKSLEIMKFNALIRQSTDYVKHFNMDSIMNDLDVEATDNAHLGGDLPSFLHELVLELARVEKGQIDLESLIDNVESSIIKFALSKNKSINAVLDNLNLTRGKLDFKRRKYNLMGAQY
ncbi:sigma 54-interacting transcriptional regulator [Pseudoalteromonas luteoviolacea]|uniref:sigma 54-interacting transcriptional regulator n=1 Tax=Pseudoalteromonas luteoviolacea TaxID=43657 RepID=UPI00068F71FE|nr:sigma 54-interacting transcriptional regulator [Pseudoalteromonas luteoviolacea]